MRQKINKLNRIVALIVALALNFFVAPVFAMTAISDTMTSMNAGELSSHAIVFTTTGNIPANETIAIDFGEDSSYFTVNGAGTVVGDLGVTNGSARTIVGVDGLCTGHVGTGDIAASVNDSTGVLTLTTCGSYTASSATMTVNYGTAAGGTNRVTNSGTPGTYIVPIALSGGVTDSGKFAVSIITNDQVTVSTTIDPYVSMVLTQNTVTLTHPTGQNPTYLLTGINEGTANTLAANTNGATGYSISYSGATLTSSGNTIDAMAAKAADSAGNEQFGINLKANTVQTHATGADPSGGTGVAAGDYNTANQYRFVVNTPTQLASAPGPSVTTTFTVSYIANVSQTTEAGAYQTTITYICTGNF